MSFRDIAKAATAEPATPPDLAEGVRTGLATIQRLGGASVGDNTMVDAIAPERMGSRPQQPRRLRCARCLPAAALAAASGEDPTRNLIASRGRASYVGEVARGILDPGAVAVALLFSSAVVAHGGPRPDTSWLRASTTV
jgi:phosphoenolpyruvate---glycerone phosphotransferase subunit DhaL